MDDLSLELISLFAIILGLALGFFLIFDYTPTDAFFLEKNDNNAYIDGIILKITPNYNSTDNSTRLTVYGCKSFNVYSKMPINKSVNESIILQGTFSDGLLFAENYK